MTAHRKLISVEDAAEYLGVKKETVRRWMRMGRLEGYRVGDRSLRLDLADVERMAVPLSVTGIAGAQQPRRLPCPLCSRPTAVDGVLVADGLVRALCEHLDPLCTDCCAREHAAGQP